MVPIVIGVLATAFKTLEKIMEVFKIGRWIEILQSTALLRSVRILGRVLKAASWHWWENLAIHKRIATLCAEKETVDDKISGYYKLAQRDCFGFMAYQPL